MRQPLNSPAQWREWIASYAEEWARTASEQETVSAALPDGGHIMRPLGTAAIDQTEARLRIRLPPSLRALYAVSNGLLEIGPWGGLVAPLTHLGWLRDVRADDYGLATGEPAYDDGARALLGRALHVGLFQRGDGCWLLDPLDRDADEWAAYIWSRRDRSLQRFDAFPELMEHLRGELTRYRAQLEATDDQQGAYNPVLLHETDTFPIDVEQWRRFLSDWAHAEQESPDTDGGSWRPGGDDPRSGAATDQDAGGALLPGPSIESELEAHESQLGCRLPPSYRNFLLVTDNGVATDPFSDTYELADVGWVRDVVAWLVEAWEDFDYVAPLLRRALLVGDDGAGGYLLLDPTDVGDNAEWATYYFAAGDAGDLDKYRGFGAYLYEERQASGGGRGR